MENFPQAGARQRHNGTCALGEGVRMTVRVSYELQRIAHALQTGIGRGRVELTQDGCAFFVFDEPTCIHCGCTMFNACVDNTIGRGCAWVAEEPETNRGLCSACDQKGFKFSRKEGAMETKKTKKKTKKKMPSKKRRPASPTTMAKSS
jgi:hypothetical protein